MAGAFIVKVMPSISEYFSVTYACTSLPEATELPLYKKIFKCDYCDFILNIHKAKIIGKKSRIRETSNLSTDADRRTDTILESLRDLYRKKINKKMGRLTCPRVHASMRTRVHATGPRGGDGRSAPTPRF